MICIERALASAIFVAVLCFHVQISSAFVPSSFKAVRTDRTGGQVRNWVHGSYLPTLDIGDNAERDAKTVIYSGRQPSPLENFRKLLRKKDSNSNLIYILEYFQYF